MVAESSQEMVVDETARHDVDASGAIADCLVEVTLIFVALNEAADRGELILCNGGLCRFHRRRDGVVVIREILVLPDRRRRGIAIGMIAEVIRRNPGAVILARCPVEYEANTFWPLAGFRLKDTKEGINLWELP